MNFFLVATGNILGGGVMVFLAYHLIYRRTNLGSAKLD